MQERVSVHVGVRMQGHRVSHIQLAGNYNSVISIHVVRYKYDAYFNPSGTP